MERKMKDSGIPWIGKIPEHWEASKIGQLYDNRYVRVSDKDFEPLSVTMQGILPQLETAAKTDDGDNRKLVRKGDFAINSRSDRRGSCGISPQDGSVSLINLILAPRTSMNADYYNWLFHTTLFADEFYSWGHGIVADLWTTRWQEMKNIAIPVPPLAELERIASYLDAKCGEIDELIEVEQQMISDLESYRQAVITEAVTHGLNPSENNTDSGVYWIGYVPSKWHIAKMKYFITITNGSDPKTEGDVPVYGSGASSFKTCGEFKEGPTVLIGRKGATLHIPHYIEGRYWNVDTAFDTRVNNFNLRYFYYLASSLDYRAYISATTLPSMTQSNYENMLIPVPPLAEQQEIAEYLDTKCSEIDELIKVKQEKIETLKQYRQSLIFEAVTGKIRIDK